MGYKYLLDEKERLYNQSKFLISMMVNNITEFNNYVKMPNFNNNQLFSFYLINNFFN